MLKNFRGEHPLLYKRADERIKIFERKPNDTPLHNHVLKRKMKGKWAFSVTGDIRIVYEWKSKTVVRFLAIGGHKKVYKKVK